MKTVVIDGVEYELLQRTHSSAWRIDEGAKKSSGRVLFKPYLLDLE